MNITIICSFWKKSRKWLFRESFIYLFLMGENSNLMLAEMQSIAMLLKDQHMCVELVRDVLLTLKWVFPPWHRVSGTVRLYSVKCGSEVWLHISCLLPPSVYHSILHSCLDFEWLMQLTWKTDQFAKWFGWALLFCMVLQCKNMS